MEFKNNILNRLEIILEKTNLLNPREEEILRLRYGIGKDKDYTLDEIGREFNLSRERIRQLEKRALKKLRYQLKIYS